MAASAVVTSCTVKPRSLSASATRLLISTSSSTSRTVFGAPRPIGFPLSGFDDIRHTPTRGGVVLFNLSEMCGIFGKRKVNRLPNRAALAYITRTMANRENTFIEITPEVLLKAYACGIFPMAENADDPALYCCLLYTS